MLQLAFVDLLRARPDRALLDPPARVLAERDLSGVGIDPVTADDVGLDGRQPTTGVGLRSEGVLGSNLFAEMPVAGLVLAAGQLADVSE